MCGLCGAAEPCWWVTGAGRYLDVSEGLDEGDDDVGMEGEAEDKAHLALGLGIARGRRSFGLSPSAFDELCLLDMVRSRIGMLIAGMQLKVARLSVALRVKAIAESRDNLHPTSTMELRTLTP